MPAWKLLSFAESGMYPWRTLYQPGKMRATVFNYIECDYNRWRRHIGVAALVRNNLKTRTSLRPVPYYVGRITLLPAGPHSCAQVPLSFGLRHSRQNSDHHFSHSPSVLIPSSMNRIATPWASNPLSAGSYRQCRGQASQVSSPNNVAFLHLHTQQSQSFPIG